MEIGYSRIGTREVVDVAKCPVLSPELDAAYSHVRAIVVGRNLPDLTGVEITGDIPPAYNWKCQMPSQPSPAPTVPL